MNAEEFLEKLGRLTDSIEDRVNIYCKRLNNCANDIKTKSLEKNSHFLADGMHEFKQLCNNENIKSIDRSIQEQIKKIKELEDIKADLEKKIAQVEPEKENLKGNGELSKRIDKLNNLRVMLKCVQSIFPATFDYNNNKNVAGFLYNKETQNYCGFELPLTDNPGNTKYAWRLLEKLFLQ